MTRDIVPELLEKIQKEFKSKTAKSKVLKSKILALQSQKATHKDSNEFAIELGKILADTFKGEITEDVLPDGKMYYNIAKRLIEPNLKNNYDLVSDFSKEVQEVLNQKSNISLKAIKPEINQDRIDGIIEKIMEYDDFENGKWLLDEPIKNFTQSIVDDTIKTNADFQYKSGLAPKIIRKEAGNCCDWCKEVVGVYEYPHVPKDVYRRHQYCRCTVDYVPGNGKKQDVWSKKWKDIDESDKIILRKELNKISNSTLNAHTLKKLEEKNWTPSFKAKAIKFYRETSKAGVEFSDHSVARTLQRVINGGLMNQEEILQLLKGKAKYVQDDGRLVFNRGNVYFIKNQNTGDIVSVVIRDEPKESWREING